MDDKTKKLIFEIFQKHPASVGETYTQHFLVACKIGLWCIATGLIALIHALIPSLFITTATDQIKELHKVALSRTPKA